jgi:voltage-gated potassium channel
MGAMLGAAALVHVLEEHGGGSIHTFGDSLWWAVTTVTTVGYGDTFPVTPAGRAVAAVLMVGGIALFGVLTANVAAFLIEEEGGESADIVARLDEVLLRLDAIETRLSTGSTPSHES